MNIMMVSGHACPRVHKMAVCLHMKGHKIYNASKKGLREDVVWCYTNDERCNSIEQYMDMVAKNAPHIDVFHCHNEPSWFVQVVKEFSDVPVILDVHDSNLARITPEEDDRHRETPGVIPRRINTEERTNFQLADGLVFVGERFANLICEEYRLTQPRLILPSYLPRVNYEYNGRQWQGGLVYEGRVDLPAEHKDTQTGFHYCDYLELARKCKDLQMDFHLYPCRNDDKFVAAYNDLCILHSPRPPAKLIGDLQKHDWGLVGNISETAEWTYAFPNKMFEYIAASVPVVAINAPACGAFLRETGMGIEVLSMEELAMRWSEHTEVRKVLIKRRQEFTMDAHIHKLEKFYEEVIGACRHVYVSRFARQVSN